MYLAYLETHHYEELIADFQQFYHIDCDSVAPLRRAVLAVQLPSSARCTRLLDWRNSWSAEQYMLALVIDEIEALRYEQRGGKGSKPKPLERPKKQAPKKKEKHYIGKEHLDRLLFGSKNGVTSRNS